MSTVTSIRSSTLKVRRMSEFVLVRFSPSGGMYCRVMFLLSPGKSVRNCSLITALGSWSRREAVTSMFVSRRFSICT